jgi:hypothetical protein
MADEVVRERDLSFAALAFASARADFAFTIFDDQTALRPFRARRNLSRQPTRSQACALA